MQFNEQKIIIITETDDNDESYIRNRGSSHSYYKIYA